MMTHDRAMKLLEFWTEATTSGMGQRRWRKNRRQLGKGWPNDHRRLPTATLEVPASDEFAIVVALVTRAR
jgi:hypothetical protein